MKYCKGCPVKDRCNYTEYSTLCPCRICLVKMICNNVCNEHIDFQIHVMSMTNGSKS